MSVLVPPLLRKLCFFCEYCSVPNSRGVDARRCSSTANRRFGSWRVKSVLASSSAAGGIADMFACVVALSMKLACSVWPGATVAVSFSSPRAFVSVRM